MSENEAELTLAQASRMLAGRQLSASDLLEATLRQISATEPHLHAYAAVLNTVARDAARRADRELTRKQRRSPLHGIPVAVKDNFYTNGVATEMGSRVMAGFVPNYDATVVHKLREAGAILVGKTTLHEFAAGVNVPPTRNPWQLDHYPGGSSAGSGVAVAAFAAFAAMGTDTGGSVRIPAAVNGIVGMKPTYGLISRHGVFPFCYSLDTVGILARTSEDLALVLGVVAGHDPNDSSSIDSPVHDYTANLGKGIARLRLGVDRSYFLRDATPDVARAFDLVISDLVSLGADVVEIRIPELEKVVAVQLTIELPETAAIHRQLLSTRFEDYDPATRVLLELGLLTRGVDYVEAQRARSVIAEAVRQAFGVHRLDALVSPTLPDTSMPISEIAMLPIFDRAGVPSYIRHTMVSTLTGLPAITVACGLAESGLPLGVEFVGRPLAEADIIAVAHAYETHRSWGLRPPHIYG